MIQYLYKVHLEHYIIMKIILLGMCLTRQWCQVVTCFTKLFFYLQHPIEYFLKICKHPTVVNYVFIFYNFNCIKCNYVWLLYILNNFTVSTIQVRGTLVGNFCVIAIEQNTIFSKNIQKNT